MKLGSLFDGIAGFPLAAGRHGISTAWASEIEAYPIAVSRRHFPDMKHLGSVTGINGAEIEPVDVITFGSPCQDLSIAGKQRGLGEDTTTAGRFRIKAAPVGWKIRDRVLTVERWAEVQGVMSARKATRSGLFFQAVRIIEEMREATKDDPEGPKPVIAVWENVPGAFSSNAGRDFAAVLQKLVGGTVDVPRRGWTRAGVVFGPNGQAAWRTFDAQLWGVPQRRRRIFLVTDFGGERAGQILFEPESLPRDSTKGKEQGCETTEGVAGGTGTGGRPIPFGLIGHATYAALNPECRNVDVCGPICARDGKSGVGNQYVEDGKLVVQPVIQPTDSAVAAVDVWHLRETARSNTLLSKSTGGYSLNYQNPVRIGYIVRRLTPTECERLQGYIDGWTACGVDEDGAPVNGSDTARYKALGNSVAIPCVEFIMRRIAEVIGNGGAVKQQAS